MQKFITSVYLLGMAVFSQSMLGQVGINTKTPNATLDITPKTTDGSKPEGLLIPQLDGNSLKTAAYGTAQKGVIVYAKSPASPTDTKTVNVTAEGFYYFDGSVWQRMTGASSGDTTNDAWVNDTTNSLVKLGTKADGTARAVGTDFVAKDNGQIGIGTVTPNASAVLDITSTNKGVLIPRVALIGTTDVTTVSSPANGLMIYNTSQTTGANAVDANFIYIWNGSEWSKVTTNSSSTFIPLTNLVRRSNINQATSEYSGVATLNTQISQISDGNWNSSSNTYTIPTDGTYQIGLSESVIFGANNAFYSHAAGFISNGTNFSTLFSQSGNWLGGAGTGLTLNGTTVLYLTAGTTIRPVYQNCSCSAGQTYSLRNVTFSILKLSN